MISYILKNKFLFSSLFILLFTAIYYIFSHEIYSPYMTYAFLYPLFGGIIWTLFFRNSNFLAQKIYILGISILISASILQGIHDIAGTQTKYIVPYAISGSLVVIISFIAKFLNFQQKENDKKVKLCLIFFFVSLFLYSVYILLDTFLIPKAHFKEGNLTTKIQTKNNAVITDNSYESDDVSIKIDSKIFYGEKLYFADIRIKKPDKLKTGLAWRTFGLNIEQFPSEIAKEYGAILAINGDNYGCRINGFVMRNKFFYRTTLTNWFFEDLIINKNGDFSTIHESLTKPEHLIKEGAVQIFSFGPTLVKDGRIVFNYGKRYKYLKSKQPRTAICQVGPLHYIFAVTDGRLVMYKSGLEMYELAQAMHSLGCNIAYNLDGGGSTAMIFNGKVVNKPSTYGIKIIEREVSDIIYIEK